MTDEPKDLLSDPNAVHLNMLAGKIAKPSWEQILHIYQPQGRVIWADGPPPDRAEGEWLVELLGRYRHVGRWKRDAWETPVGHAHAESITRHARLE